MIEIVNGFLWLLLPFLLSCWFRFFRLTPAWSEISATKCTLDGLTSRNKKIDPGTHILIKIKMKWKQFLDNIEKVISVWYRAEQQRYQLSPSYSFKRPFVHWKRKWNICVCAFQSLPIQRLTTYMPIERTLRWWIVYSEIAFDRIYRPLRLVMFGYHIWIHWVLVFFRSFVSYLSVRVFFVGHTCRPNLINAKQFFFLHWLSAHDCTRNETEEKKMTPTNEGMNINLIEYLGMNGLECVCVRAL